MALADFVELNPMAPMQLLLEGLNDRKTLPQDNILRIMENVASYMDCLQLEISVSAWVGILTHFETFFRKLVLILPANADMTPTLRIICSILHIQGLNSYKVC